MLIEDPIKQLADFPPFFSPTITSCIIDDVYVEYCRIDNPFWLSLT